MTAEVRIQWTSRPPSAWLAWPFAQAWRFGIKTGDDAERVDEVAEPSTAGDGGALGIPPDLEQ